MQQALVQTVQNQAPRHKYEDRRLEITWFAFGIRIYIQGFFFSSYLRHTQKPINIIEHPYFHIYFRQSKQRYPAHQAPSHHRDVCCGWAPFVDAFAVRRDSMASCRWRSHLRWGWPSVATPGVGFFMGNRWLVDDKTTAPINTRPGKR